MILSKKIRIYPTETPEKKLKQAINTKKNKIVKGGSCQYIKTKNIEKLENIFL